MELQKNQNAWADEVYAILQLSASLMKNCYGY